jgi:acetolactate synthase I/II/III large subunit
MKRLADFVIEYLLELDINQYYALTGRGILYLTDALAANPKVKKLFLHHEQACAYAACGHTDLSGRPSVVLVSTGVGSTNAISGVLNAWQDNLPVIFISGQNKLEDTKRYSGGKQRTFGNQELDIIEIVKPITKFALMVTDKNEIRNVLDDAYLSAMTNRRGPVWIDIPLDLQSSYLVNEKDTLTSNVRAYPKKNIMLPDLDELRKLLINSQRPLIVIGSGVRDSGMSDKLIEFIERYDIPLVFTPSASDVIGLDLDLSIGCIGTLGGSPAGNVVLQKSDLLIVLGSRLSPVVTGDNFKNFGKDAKKVVVDLDVDEHERNLKDIDLFFHNRLEDFIIELNQILITKSYNEWALFCKEQKQNLILNEIILSKNGIDLHFLAKKMSDLKVTGHHFVVDSGLNELIFPSVGAYSPSNRCIHPYSQGAMGYALPAGIGVALASKNKVNIIVGDGSIMLNIQELETISKLALPIKIFVINNGNYSIIRTRQQELFRSRTIGTDESNGVSTPNFELISKAFNIEYLRIDYAEQVEEKLRYVYSLDFPIIAEIMTNKAQKYLKPTIYKDRFGKLKSTSLEDLHLHFTNRSEK